MYNNLQHGTRNLVHIAWNDDESLSPVITRFFTFLDITNPLGFF